MFPVDMMVALRHPYAVRFDHDVRVAATLGRLEAVGRKLDQQTKRVYNRWKRWGDMGVFARMMEGLASEATVPKTVMIDATYLKAHRTASSLGLKKGGAVA
jgi:transposase